MPKQLGVSTMPSSSDRAVTRVVFENLSSAELVVWYTLVAISTAILFYGIYQLYKKYRMGSSAKVFDLAFTESLARLKSILTHSAIRRRNGWVGYAHMAMFYGFVVLFIGTVTITLEHDITRPLFGFQFWYGRFYLVFSLLLELAGVALILGLALMMVRRGILRPDRLRYPPANGQSTQVSGKQLSMGDWSFLLILFFIPITGFLLEALRIAIEAPDFERYSFVGWQLSELFRGWGAVEGGKAQSYHYAVWWIHGVVSIFFVSSIPFTKAMHMLVAPTSMLSRSASAGANLGPSGLGELPEIDDEASPGYVTFSDFSTKHLLQLDACTRCGKCHEACPAQATGHPLSPRDLILNLSEQAAKCTDDEFSTKKVPGELIQQSTLWSCMQCMACTEICPVGIEQVPIINQLRQPLVEEGEFDTLLQTAFENVMNVGNSFGESKRKRARWTKGLEFKIKDIRKEKAEYLWFVGDYASFDTRNAEVTKQLATLFERANVDVGILYDAEKTAGNDIRRAGEEGLWRSIAEDNIEQLASCSFDKIICRDPHTYNTLKNEYPSLGAPWTADQVFHYTEVLNEFVVSGKLSPIRKLKYKVTYHDPCTLGRYNGIYDPPRELLLSTGVELKEMGRVRDNSFCCGAGGGRIWMKDIISTDQPRPSEMRINEATSLGELDYFIVACPKDVTMYEDAIKTSGQSETLAVRELTEILCESYMR